MIAPASKPNPEYIARQSQPKEEEEKKPARYNKKDGQAAFEQKKQERTRDNEWSDVLRYMMYDVDGIRDITD